MQDSPHVVSFSRGQERRKGADKRKEMLAEVISKEINTQKASSSPQSNCFIPSVSIKV